MHPVPTLQLNHRLIQHPDGFWMGLGANIRPLQPREIRYSFGLNFFYGDEDYTSPVSLSHFQGSDIRSEVGDQGEEGDCAVKSAEDCVTTSARGAGWTDIPVFHNGYGYELVRKVEDPNNWKADNGSTLGDNADLLLKPVNIKLSDVPFVGDPGYDYGDRSQLAANENLLLLQSHNPIWPDNTVNFLKAVHAALRMGYAVQFGSYWPEKWFSPDANGILPNATLSDTMAGAHAYRCWGMINGWFLLRNQWTPGFNPQVTKFGNDCQPGDMVMSWDMAMNAPGGSHSLIFESRAYVPLPAPHSNPQPTPLESDAFWKWTTNEGAAVLTWQDESVRRQQAQVLYSATKNWYPGVK